jgi:putative FmdB family regulatory protein
MLSWLYLARLRTTEIDPKLGESIVPLYEYVCSRCRRQFEELVLGHEQPHCPGCGAAEVERILSVVNASTTSKASAAPDACDTCGDPRGPGSCASS